MQLNRLVRAFSCSCIYSVLSLTCCPLWAVAPPAWPAHEVVDSITSQSQCSNSTVSDMPRCWAAGLALLLHVTTLACAQQQPGSLLLSSRAYATDGQPGAVLAPNTALQGLPLGELPAGSPTECVQQCMQDDECSWVNYCPKGQVGSPAAAAAAAAFSVQPALEHLNCRQMLLRQTLLPIFSCPLQGECPGAGGQPLGPGLCSLLAANGSAVPAVQRAGIGVDTVGGE